MNGGNIPAWVKTVDPLRPGIDELAAVVDPTRGMVVFRFVRSMALPVYVPVPIQHIKIALSAILALEAQGYVAPPLQAPGHPNGNGQ